MLAPIIGWLTDLSLLRFDMDWFKDERLRRLKSLPDDIPEKDKVIIEGFHKRKLLAKEPSDTDLKYLEDAYKSKYKMTCYNYYDSKLFCFVTESP